MAEQLAFQKWNFSSKWAILAGVGDEEEFPKMKKYGCVWAPYQIFSRQSYSNPLTANCRIMGFRAGRDLGQDQVQPPHLQGTSGGFQRSQMGLANLKAQNCYNAIITGPC